MSLQAKDALVKLINFTILIAKNYQASFKRLFNRVSIAMYYLANYA